MNQSKLQSHPYLQRLREKWFEVLVGAILVAITVGVFWFSWQVSNQRVVTDYEGTIVDRWGVYSATEQGSRPVLRLAIESPDGTRFNVRVEPNVYDSARVGMRIKSTAGKIVLMDSEPGRTAGK